MAQQSSEPLTAPSPDIDSQSCLLQAANQYLNKNEFEQAYPLLVQLADGQDAKPQIARLAGLVAQNLNRPAEAVKHLKQAVALAPGDFDTNHNLVLLHIQLDNLDEAETILNRLIADFPDRAGLHNDLGVVLSRKNELDLARECFSTALALDPELVAARENLESLERSTASDPDAIDKNTEFEIDLSGEDKPTRPEAAASVEVESAAGFIEGKKIVFFADHVTFLKDIMARVETNNEVRLVDGRSADQMRDCLEWADLAWFEWCDELMIRGSNLPRLCPVICRLHSYEAFTDMPAQVDWRKVDRLVFVNQSVQEIFERQVDCQTQRTVIYNAVDTQRFSIPNDKPRGKKIASVGYINSKKNPTLLLYCFKKIHEFDPEFSLHIAGQFQDPGIELYFEHFLKHNPLPVTFDGWIHDMPGWYADKDYVISTSLFESFHYSIAEGMACGLVPLIHNWFGAEYLYPREFLYNDPDDCLALLQRMENERRPDLVENNRTFIKTRYGLEFTQDKIIRLMAEVAQIPIEAAPSQTERV